MQEKPSKLIPALIGGAFIGVLSSVPVINMGNCLCCMWIILGGIIAVYYYSRKLPQDQMLVQSDGAVVGLLAGVFGALFSSLLTYLLMAMIGFVPGQGIIDFLESNDMSGEWREMLELISEGGAIHPFFVLMSLIFGLVVNSAFGFVGGLLGVSLFRKKTPPAGTPPQPVSRSRKRTI